MAAGSNSDLRGIRFAGTAAREGRITMSSVSSILPQCSPVLMNASGHTNLTMQRIADLTSIGTSLENGDLASAQQGFAALMQITSFVNPNGRLAQDVSALGSALQSGNVAGAQQALSNLGNLMVGYIEKQGNSSGLSSGQSAVLAQLEAIPGVTGPSSATKDNSSPTSTTGSLNVIA
jgi:hypothetical protein